MNAAFLETTALIDLLFKDRETAQAVLECCVRESRKVSSQYVIYELSRGFLRNLIILHNATLKVTRYCDLLTYIGRSARRFYFVGTTMSAFKAYRLEGRKRGIIRDRLRMDEEQADLEDFREFLRYSIRFNWRRLRSSLDQIVNHLQCREEIGDPYLKNERFKQELKKHLCGDPTKCGLKAYLMRNRQEFAKIRSVLQDTRSDEETDRRVDALKHLDETGMVKFRKSHCYSASDALIAHEAPHNSRLISKNKKHFEPLCTILNKKYEFYVDPDMPR